MVTQLKADVATWTQFFDGYVSAKRLGASLQVCQPVAKKGGGCELGAWVGCCLDWWVEAKVR